VTATVYSTERIHVLRVGYGFLGLIRDITSTCLCTDALE